MPNPAIPMRRVATEDSAYLISCIVHMVDTVTNPSDRKKFSHLLSMAQSSALDMPIYQVNGRADGRSDYATRTAVIYALMLKALAQLRRDEDVSKAIGDVKKAVFAKEAWIVGAPEKGWTLQFTKPVNED